MGTGKKPPDLVDFKSTIGTGTGKTAMQQTQAYAHAAGQTDTAAYRQTAKLAAHAVPYGGVPHTVFHDEIMVQVSPHELAVSAALPGDEWCWAVAFRIVYGVGEQFYEQAPAKRKRHLEQHTEELATHDTPKGRKAARVVAQRVRLTLEERKPLGMGWYTGTDWSRPTGRLIHDDQRDALKRYINFPRPK